MATLFDYGNQLRMVGVGRIRQWLFRIGEENMTELILLGDAPKFTEAELKLFERKYLSVMQTLSDNVKQKKKLEDNEKKIKSQLEKVMDNYGIKSIDNQFLKITRVAGSQGKKTIDTDKLQKEEPELYTELLKDYPKTTGVRKESVKFNVK